MTSPEQQETDVIRESLKCSADGELVRMAAKRAVEQSVLCQISTGTVEEGMVDGIEFLLREPLPGELPENHVGDFVLDAMRDELRARIVQRFGSRGNVDG